MAQLLTWLASAGARTSAGAPVASGFAWFYDIGGGTTQADVYEDVDGVIIATQPVALDAGGRATVYTIAPVRVVIQDATGADVSDLDQMNVNRAEAVQVDNADWTDGYLDGVLTAIGTSVGGTNGMYMESGGATARTVKAKFSELSISVKDFGAKGDGLTVDTTAIQAAINRAAFLGGGEVYFPPGTYLLDQTLTNATSGVSYRGASATLKNTHASNNTFTITGASNWAMRGLYLTNTGTGTGTAVAISGGTTIVVSNVRTDRQDIPVSVGGTTPARILIDSCYLVATDNAAARGVSVTDCSAFTMSNTYVYGGTAGYSMEFLGSSNGCTTTGSYLDTTGVKFNSNLTGVGHRFIGNAMGQLTTPLTFATTIPKGFYQAGNGVDGYTITVATGATAAVPTLAFGNEITINASSGGAGTVTVPDIAILPDTTTRGLEITIKYKNAAGGNVTWAYAAALFVHVGAAVPAATAAHTILVKYLWDGTTSKFREICRGDTAT